jgi:oxidase EvaA
MPELMNPKAISDSFFRSYLFTSKSLYSIEEIIEWMKLKNKRHQFKVSRIAFNEMEHWHFEHKSGDLVHSTNRFFRVEALSCKQNFGQVRSWQQPIINQQEIGILGFISKEFEGVRHFLLQAKMEPGNINTIQLSPTVQATHSNYQKVHKGKTPRYLEYFLSSQKRIMVDQLQSEQGTRFLRKRNRNIIIDCKDAIEEDENFIWVTLGQLKTLTALDNHINMEARSILSCIPILPNSNLLENIKTQFPSDEFNQKLLSSVFEKNKAHHTKEEILQWMTEYKSNLYIRNSYLPLVCIDDGWENNGYEITHNSKKFFSILAVAVEAPNREVSKWTQPLINSLNPSINGWICRTINDVLHFLVKIRLEPGSIDLAELSPTVATTEGESCVSEKTPPPYYQYFLHPSKEQIRHSSLQSAEGGRFYHDTFKCIILEIDDFDLSVPSNHRWMTLGQILEFMTLNNMINVECRDLIACINLAEKYS